MTSELTLDQLTEVHGGNVLAAGLGFAGGLIASHYGEKLLNAFDDAISSTYSQRGDFYDAVNGRLRANIY